MPIVLLPHRDILSPSDDELTVWRFVQIPKLLDVLATRSMYFVQVAEMRQLDPFEAHFPLLSIKQRSQLENPESQMHVLSRYASVSAHTCYISCWHMNQHESSALWSIYARGDAGIAINSTVGLIKRSFSKIEDRIELGLVKYLDYETSDLQSGYDLVFHKRMSFAFESELRLCIRKYPDEKPNEFVPETNNPKGLRIECDLEELMDEIVISPLSPGWLVDAIHETVKRFSVHATVRKSTLLEPPEYAVRLTDLDGEGG